MRGEFVTQGHKGLISTKLIVDLKSFQRICVAVHAMTLRCGLSNLIVFGIQLSISFSELFDN